MGIGVHNAEAAVVGGDELNFIDGAGVSITVAASTNADSDVDITVAASGVDNAQLTAGQRKREARSVWFNLDNGAGTTVDDVILKLSVAYTILAARIIYVDATTGVVAAGNAKIGTTLGGAEIVAATAYEDTKAVGTSTAMVISAGAVAAAGSVFIRHTGVAAVAAGQAVVEVEYSID